MGKVVFKKVHVSAVVSRALALGALGVLLASCAQSSDAGDTPTPTDPARTGGSSGASTGGKTGSTGGSSGASTGGDSGSPTGGSGAGTGGSSAGGSTGTGESTGGSSGTGGAGDTGGSAGTSAGGSSGAGGGSGTDAAVSGGDAAPPSSGGKHPIAAGNVLVACKSPAKYRLPSAPAADFCAFYEMYCHYDPTGMEKNKGAAPPAGQEPWFYKDYDDCIARYTAAKPAAQSCRAGQLCGTNFKAGQGCTHATGHFDTCP
jgi:hypothetical protein